MKNLQLLLVLTIFATFVSIECRLGFAKPKPKNPCREPKEIGNCKAIKMRFFYNIETRNCEVFRYGGCRGNSNNFKSHVKCMHTCMTNILPMTRPLPRPRPCIPRPCDVYSVSLLPCKPSRFKACPCPCPRPPKPAPCKPGYDKNCPFPQPSPPCRGKKCDIPSPPCYGKKCSIPSPSCYGKKCSIPSPPCYGKKCSIPPPCYDKKCGFPPPPPCKSGYGKTCPDHPPPPPPPPPPPMCIQGYGKKCIKPPKRCKHVFEPGCKFHIPPGRGCRHRPGRPCPMIAT